MFYQIFLIFAFCLIENPHAMAKQFNITGSCNPERHYMVDSQERFLRIKKMIDAGDYFTINRGRQFGKTTTLNMIWRQLSDQYLVIPLSFEGIGDTPFSDASSFTSTFCSMIHRYLVQTGIDEQYSAILDKPSASSFDELSETLTNFCKTFPKPIVLMIDEVDKSSDNQLFLSFIGMLRSKYLERENGLGSTFHSVILAGVYDIKNLKIKLRPDEEKKYNSPWNIATDFNVDMSFSAKEIAQMLTEYENDYHTGMDILSNSEEIYKFTSGYPFLVSKICKVIDEELDKDWNPNGVMRAVKLIVDQKNTLFDSLTKNLENDKAFKDFIYAISMLDASITFTFSNPLIEMGNMFSYIKRGPDNNVMMHNLIFEEVVHNHFVAEELIASQAKFTPYNDKSQYVHHQRLDMEQVIRRFADFLHEEFRKEDVNFLEQQGRLLFLSFLKPIINGTGSYYVEPQTRNNKRMDLIVNYNNEEFVVELKIWRGQKYEEKGKEQLAEYLTIRGLEKGYLVTFDFSNKQRNSDINPPTRIIYKGKQIFEAII